MAVIDNTLSQALAQVPGLWENPVTKNTYHFKKIKRGSYAVMEVLQHATGVKIIYAYKILYGEDKILCIEIDNIVFEVVELKYVNDITMKLKNPAGHIIKLQRISGNTYTLLVLYSRLPAQFFNFSPCAQAASGDTKGVAISADDNFKKVLLFMPAFYVSYNN